MTKYVKIIFEDDSGREKEYKFRTPKIKVTKNMAIIIFMFLMALQFIIAILEGTVNGNYITFMFLLVLAPIEVLFVFILLLYKFIKDKKGKSVIT